MSRFQCRHFQPIVVLLKLNCLVTLFDHLSGIQKTRQIDHVWREKLQKGYFWLFSNTVFFDGFQVKGTLEGFPLMLVGNKCDDDSKREVNKKTGEALQVGT